MFTVKVRRYKYENGNGNEDDYRRDKVSIYECRSVDVEDHGVVLHGMGNPEDEAFVPYHTPGDSSEGEWEVSQIIVENMAGKTTEVIRV